MGFDIENWLSDLEPAEVSIVKRGANKKKYLVKKSLEFGEDRMKESILKAVVDTPLDNQAEVDAVLKEAKLGEEASGVLTAITKLLGAYQEVLPQGTLSLLAKCSGYPLPEARKEEPKIIDPQYGYPITKSGELDLSEVPDEVKPALEKLWKSNQELVAKNLQMEDEARTKQFIAKAESFKTLPVEPAKFASVLKSFQAKAPVEYDEIIKVLEAIDNIATASGPFQELGRASATIPASGAWNTIVAKAKSVVAKSGSGTLEQAIDEVCKSNPDLYKSYLQEQHAQAGGMS